MQYTRLCPRAVGKWRKNENGDDCCTGFLKNRGAAFTAEPSSPWIETVCEARAVVDAFAPRPRLWEPTTPTCLAFFELTAHAAINDLKSASQKWPPAAHPDRGGDLNAFKLARRSFEQTLRGMEVES